MTVSTSEGLPEHLQRSRSPTLKGMTSKPLRIDFPLAALVMIVWMSLLRLLMAVLATISETTYEGIVFLISSEDR